MTREEILKMEAGREMDCAIAEEIFGWKILTKIPPLIWINNPADKANGGYGNRVPHYSTDIAAAWEVVKKLVSIEEEGFTKWQVVIDSDGINRWIADFKDDPLHTTNCSAPTAPLAICRAALLAIMKE